MTEQNVTANAAEEKPLSPIELRIPVDNLSMDVEGMVTRSLVLRLPRGVEMRHLIENSRDCFFLLQKSTASLRRFDRLLVIAFDESWVASTIVASATDSDVAIAKPSIVSMAARTAQLPGDENHIVEWVGTGYCVVRRKDGHRMTLPVGSLAVAQRELSNLYSRAVS